MRPAITFLNIQLSNSRICPVSFVFRNVCTEVYEGYGDIMMTDWNTCLRKISENLDATDIIWKPVI